jgi:pimeloyl-ACP methyl ester carboxylesterase
MYVKSSMFRSKEIIRGAPVASYLRTATTTLLPVDPESTLLYYEWIFNSRQEDVKLVDQAKIIFLHGMLANSSNIKHMARKVCHLQKCRGLLLDLPGHGRSRDTTTIGDEMNFSKAAHLIQKTVQMAMHHPNDPTTQASSVLQFMGHSLGGHLSLYYASRPDVEPKPSVLWLLDTIPSVVDASFRKVWNAVKVLQGQELSNPETLQKELLVRDFHLSPLTAQWLQSQYHFSEGKFVFDRNVVESLLQDFANQNFYSQLQAVLDSNIVVHLIQAERNRAWKECLGNIQQFDGHDNFFRHVLPNAGHLVYIDNLPGLLDIIVGTSDSMVLQNQ